MQYTNARRGQETEKWAVCSCSMASSILFLFDLKNHSSNFGKVVSGSDSYKEDVIVVLKRKIIL